MEAVRSGYVEAWFARILERELAHANAAVVVALERALNDEQEIITLRQHLIRHQAEVFRLSDLLRKADPKWGSGMHLNKDEPRLTHKTRDGDVVSGETNE